MNGVVVIDKPAGYTSHDVVNRVRRILHEKSVGHLGTLDPMATGVLPMVVGTLTRLAQFYTGAQKTYEGVIRFGFSTDTYDAEGEATSVPQDVVLSLDQARVLASQFCGVIEQVPPPFSAKKIHGVPAYTLARQHKEVLLDPVRVEVRELEILSVEQDRATFRALVASGTYLRSLAHDMGARLGCGAHLDSLRRTSVGEFSLADAHGLEAVDIANKAGEMETILIHPRKLLPEFPAVTANDEAVTHIRNGRTINLPEFSRARQVRVFQGQHDLIAIATRIAGTLFHPKIVLSVSSPKPLEHSHDS